MKGSSEALAGLEKKEEQAEAEVVPSSSLVEVEVGVWVEVGLGVVRV